MGWGNELIGGGLMGGYKHKSIAIIIFESDFFSVVTAMKF